MKHVKFTWSRQAHEALWSAAAPIRTRQSMVPSSFQQLPLPLLIGSTPLLPPSIILIYNCLTTSIRSMPWTMSAHSARTESPAFYSVLRITESHCMTHSCVEMILGVGKSPPPTLHDSCCWVDFVEWFSMSQKW